MHSACSLIADSKKRTLNDSIQEKRSNLIWFLSKCCTFEYRIFIQRLQLEKKSEKCETDPRTISIRTLRRARNNQRKNQAFFYEPQELTAQSSMYICSLAKCYVWWFHTVRSSHCEQIWLPLCQYLINDARVCGWHTSSLTIQYLSLIYWWSREKEQIMLLRIFITLEWFKRLYCLYWNDYGINHCESYMPNKCWMLVCGNISEWFKSNAMQQIHLFNEIKWKHKNLPFGNIKQSACLGLPLRQNDGSHTFAAAKLMQCDICGFYNFIYRHDIPADTHREKERLEWQIMIHMIVRVYP